MIDVRFHVLCQENLELLLNTKIDRLSLKIEIVFYDKDFKHGA